jgi:glycosyltransferase involved in cell wall biosynthesis
MPDDAVDLTVVIPMYNEQAVLPLLVERLRPVADAWGVTYEILCVDDGSSDATPVLLQRLVRQWEQVRVVRLRANAGHQAAISAGLALARGAWVVTIDADLQDPPEVIGEMLAVAQGQAVDVVYGVREDRSTDTVFKRVTAGLFYRSIRALSDVDAEVGAGDFRLMSRATVDAVNALPEHNRVLRLVVPALGFPSGSVGYARAARAAGDSKYPLAKMIRLSIDGLTGFSLAPLRLATWMGLVGGLAALGVLVYAFGAMLLGNTLPGWTSTVVIVAAVGAVQLLALGILGEYVGRTYTALQGRPTYFVAHDSLGSSLGSSAGGEASGRGAPARAAGVGGTGVPGGGHPGGGHPAQTQPGDGPPAQGLPGDGLPATGLPRHGPPAQGAPAASRPVEAARHAAPKSQQQPERGSQTRI